MISNFDRYFEMDHTKPIYVVWKSWGGFPHTPENYSIKVDLIRITSDFGFETKRENLIIEWHERCIIDIGYYDEMFDKYAEYFI